MGSRDEECVGFKQPTQAINAYRNVVEIVKMD
jgi:hypothetical protein